jgi:hypothetical protein
MAERAPADYVVVLGLMAAGHSTAEILASCSWVTPELIASAARFAVELAAGPPARSGPRVRRSFPEFVEELRLTHPNAYRSWTWQEDERVTAALHEGLPAQLVAARHGRTTGAINSRWKKLGLLS